MKNPSRKQIESPLRSGKGVGDRPGGLGPRPREATIGWDEAPPLLVLQPAPVRADVARKRRPASTTRARVLVVDGHPLVEEWIGTLIEGEADLVFAGHAAELAETASLVARGRPSLVLLEIAPDVPRSLEIVRALKAKYPKLRLLVFSSCEEVTHAVQILRAGASGFVSKTASGPELLQAIRHVLADGVYLSSAMISHLATFVPDSRPAPGTGPSALLSERELQVFAFIGEGLRPTEIARQISLSVKTIESYLARIREKLALKDAHAVFQSAVKWSKARDTAGQR